jgi:hypothetical protein
MTRGRFVALAVSAVVLAVVAAVSLDVLGRRSTTLLPVPAPAVDASRAEAPSVATEERTNAASPTPKRRSTRSVSTSDRSDEASIMAELRTLEQSDPVRSLELVRVGEARFPGSEDAPERAWYKIRSLVNLRRFEDARAEALAMVDTYRDTPWAGDVERHLLTQPLNHPDQRGNLTD